MKRTKETNRFFFLLSRESTENKREELSFRLLTSGFNFLKPDVSKFRSDFAYVSKPQFCVWREPFLLEEIFSQKCG